MKTTGILKDDSKPKVKKNVRLNDQADFGDLPYEHENNNKALKTKSALVNFFSKKPLNGNKGRSEAEKMPPIERGEENPQQPLTEEEKLWESITTAEGARKEARRQYAIEKSLEAKEHYANTYKEVQRADSALIGYYKSQYEDRSVPKNSRIAAFNYIQARWNREEMEARSGVYSKEGGVAIQDGESKRKFIARQGNENYKNLDNDISATPVLTSNKIRTPSFNRGKMLRREAWGVEEKKEDRERRPVAKGREILDADERKVDERDGWAIRRSLSTKKPPSPQDVISDKPANGIPPPPQAVLPNKVKDEESKSAEEEQANKIPPPPQAVRPNKVNVEESKSAEERVVYYRNQGSAQVEMFRAQNAATRRESNPVATSTPNNNIGNPAQRGHDL